MAESRRSFHAASAEGDTSAVRALLSQGADPNVVDDHGLSALHHAVLGGRLETVRVLIERGANPDAKGTVGREGAAWTPLHLAAVHNQVECARFLLEAGADPDPADQIGQTPLFLAAGQENNHDARRAELVAPDVARLLIEYGASLRGTNVDQAWTGISPDAGREARLEALEAVKEATERMTWDVAERSTGTESASLPGGSRSATEESD